MMFAGSSPLNLTAVVQNFGTFVEATYQLEWMIDGQIQPAIVNSQPLQRNDQDTLTLSWPAPSLGTHTIVAWTLLASDSNQTNDSLRTTIVILDTSVVYVEGFNTPTFPPPGWTAINRDGGLLPPWFLGNSSSIFPPYEGLGFAGNNFQRANGNYIDDYLISPPIPGIGQSGYLDSLKFWVRSPTNPPPTSNYPDSLMVLLSTTGTDTTDFNIFIDYFSVPKTGWELRRYPLSELVPSNSTVYVALRYLHYNGGESGSNSDFVGVDFLHVTHNLPTSTTGSSAVPMLFNLAQNYPNPFNPTSQITFSVPTRSATKLVLYDQLGQEVRILFEGEAEPGRTYRSTIDGARLASGVYFYALTSGGLSAAKKALLVK
jgi:Secretion system C-terminal sorting domain